MSVILNTGIIEPLIIGGTGPLGPQGPQGPVGPAGTASIGGYAVSLTGEVASDILSFNGTLWTNRKQESLADGGNF